tara:strand:+ start:6696 stop:7700 length:1005 start_codon:yes stop_codon:yes gene_type:complete
MSNHKIKKIIQECNAPKREKYNILTFPTHERYETQLCKTGHNFFSFSMDGQKEWDLKQTKPPENYYILPKNELPAFAEIDMVLVQSKFWQFQIAAQILESLPVPMIVLEHTLPTPTTQNLDQIQTMRQMVGHVNIFISKFSQQQWNINSLNNYVIHHGIDSEVFKPLDVEKEDHILTVANDFKNRDFCLNYGGWERITNGMNVRLVGSKNGEGSIVCENTEDIVKEYNKCKIYLNTTTLSPIPMSLLEAMACGCAVVSTATCMIPDIIQNGVNGFISNDETELKNMIRNLEQDDELRKTIGENARKTIQQHFSEKLFTNNWNEVFTQVYEVCRT